MKPQEVNGTEELDLEEEVDDIQDIPNAHFDVLDSSLPGFQTRAFPNFRFPKDIALTLQQLVRALQPRCYRRTCLLLAPHRRTHPRPWRSRIRSLSGILAFDRGHLRWKSCLRSIALSTH